jgi:hypothetical protein
MDYAFHDRDLRVKKDVSDLKLDPIFWRRVLGKNYFFASYRLHPSAGMWRVMATITAVLQLCSHPVVGWQNARPCIFGLWSIKWRQFAPEVILLAVG